MAGFSPFPDSGPVEYSPQIETSAGRSMAEATLRHIPGVEGIGEGRNAIGDPAWVVYVRDHSVSARLPSAVGGRAVIPEVSGEISALPAR